MKRVLLLLPFLFLCGCSDYGSHAHYIISQEETSSENPTEAFKK